MKLRDYQTQVIQDVYDSLTGGSKRPLIVAATGSGKTVVMAKLLSDFVSHGLRCLVLVHLDILVPQTAEKLEAFGLEHGFIKANYAENRNAPVQIASIQTLPRRRWWRSHKFDVVLLDEAHRTAWSRIANQLMNEILPQAWFIGLTATPFRLSSKQGMGDKFDSLICAPLPAQLMQMGYLVRPVYYGTAELDLKNVRITAGDYDESDLSIVCNQPEVIKSAISEYQRLGLGERCLAFSVDVSHARNLAQAARDAGIPAAAVDGATPIPTRREYYNALARDLVPT